MPRKTYPSQGDIKNEPYLPEHMGTVEVLAKSGLSYQKLWALVHAGDFPKPVVHGLYQYWRGSDVEHWHANRQEASDGGANQSRVR